MDNNKETKMKNDLNDRWSYWWVTIEGRGSQFLYAKGKAAAQEEAGKLGTVLDIKTLPYPAVRSKSPDGCPDFCLKPRECAGKTSCPQSRSCTE